MFHHNVPGGLGAEAAALITTAGGLMDYLPKVALVLGCLWYAVNLVDWFISKVKPETATTEEEPMDDGSGC